MSVPDLDALLVVQEHDLEVNKLQKALAEMPQKYERVKKAIAAEKADFENKRSGLQAAEVAERESTGKIKEYEEKILKLRNQQLSVKKNDEYQAIEKEIAHLKELIGKEEEAGLDIIDRLEAAQEAYREAEAVHEQNLANLQQEHELVVGQETELKNRLAEEEKLLEASMSRIDAALLQQYEYVKRNLPRGPWVVIVHDHNCSGCHIRISNDSLSEARGKGIARCSNCGRMIYV